MAPRRLPASRDTDRGVLKPKKKPRSSRPARRKPAAREPAARAREASPGDEAQAVPVVVPPPQAAPDDAISLQPPREPSPFPIVGIGASAGGLEALEQFLHRVPDRSDAA